MNRYIVSSILKYKNNKVLNIKKSLLSSSSISSLKLLRKNNNNINKISLILPISSINKYQYSSSSKVYDAETREFQAETRKLLDIVTHSIYTDREVFVRELISNASDALEKFRYKQVKGEVNANDEPLEINILANKDNKTLTLIDNGIGMSKEELIENLGKILIIIIIIIQILILLLLLL